jgi:hypothetical protein
LEYYLKTFLKNTIPIYLWRHDNLNDKTLAKISVILIVALIAFGLSNSFAFFMGDIFGDLNLDILNINSNNKLSGHDESSVNYDSQKTKYEKESSDNYYNKDDTDNDKTNNDSNVNNSDTTENDSNVKVVGLIVVTTVK